MPIVPRRRSTEIEENITPNLRVNANAPLEMFGGGRTLQQTTNTITSNLSSIATGFKKQADEQVVNDALQDLSNKKNFALYDPDDGLINKRGVEALGVQSEYSETLFKEKNDILKKLWNKTQRDSFNRQASSELNSFSRIAQNHVIKETQRYQNESYNNNINQLILDSTLNINDIPKVAENASKITKLVTNRSIELGDDEVTTQYKIKEALSPLHSNMIKTLVDQGSHAEAQEYYDINKTRMTLNDIDSVEKVLKISKNKVDIDMVYEDIQKKAEDPAAAKTMLASPFYEAVPKDVKEGALKKYNVFFKGLKEQTELERTALYTEMVQELSREENEGMDALELFPVSKFAMLSPVQQRSLMSFNDSGADDTAYFEFIDLTVEDIRNINPEEFHLNYMVKIKDPEKQKQAAIFYDNVKGDDTKVITTHAFVKNYGDNNLNKNQRQNFIYQAKQVIEEQKIELGRELTKIEMLEICDDLVTEVKTGFFWGTEKLYETLDETNKEKLKLRYDFYDSDQLEQNEKTQLKQEINEEVQKFAIDNGINQKINLYRSDYMNIAYAIISNDNALLKMKIEEILKKKGLINEL